MKLSLAVLVIAIPLPAQVPVPVEHVAEAVAALNSRDNAPPLACDIRIVDPHIGFDFRFQSGYEVAIPLRHYTGSGNAFSALTRVTPVEPASAPAYFTQRVSAPDIPSHNRAHITLVGGYFLGEGKYSVDFLLSDHNGRICRKEWQIEARRSGPERGLPVALEEGKVLPYTFENWKGISDRNARPEHAFRITMLLHAHALSRRAMKLRSSDQELLLGSLASVLMQIPAAQIKVIAFNLDQQSVIFRDNDFGRASWDPLLEALENLQLGTVSYQVLANPGGYLDLLSSLIKEEESEQPDAVVFLGPPARQLDKPPASLFKTTAGHTQFFYFECDPYWYPFTEFSDSIYHTTRAIGGKVFRIRSPGDFASAIQALHGAIEPAAGSVAGTR